MVYKFILYTMVTASWQVGNETGMVGNDGLMVARCHFHFLAEFSLLNPQAHLQNNPEFIKEITH